LPALFDSLAESRGLRPIILSGAARDRAHEWEKLTAKHLENAYTLMRKKFCQNKLLPRLRETLPRLAAHLTTSRWKPSEWTKQILRDAHMKPLSSLTGYTEQHIRDIAATVESLCPGRSLTSEQLRIVCENHPTGRVTVQMLGLSTADDDDHDSDQHDDHDGDNEPERPLADDTSASKRAGSFTDDDAPSSKRLRLGDDIDDLLRKLDEF
jgi:hypothetical protein